MIRARRMTAEVQETGKKKRRKKGHCLGSFFGEEGKGADCPKDFLDKETNEEDSDCTSG